MQLDKNPWKIYRNGKLTAVAHDHATAQRIVKALYRAYPRDAYVLKFEGKSLSPFNSGSKVVER